MNYNSDYDYSVLIIDEDFTEEELEELNQSLQTRITNYFFLTNLIKQLVNVNYFLIRKDQQISLSKLIKILENLGYQSSKGDLLENRYQIRGNIIDIFSNNAIRIELEDDIVESIRIFDPNSFLTIRKMDSIKIFACNENQTIALQNLKILFLTYEPEEIVKNVLDRKLKSLDFTVDLTWDIKQISIPNHVKKIADIYETIKLIEEGYKFVFPKQETYQKYLKLILDYSRKKRKTFSLLEYEISSSPIPFGYVDLIDKKVYITERNLRSERVDVIHIDVFDAIKDFREGDLVVVEGYGIGIYLGTQKIRIAHFDEKEFICVQFKNNRKMYFSIESVNIHKYISSDKITQRIKEKILSVPSFKSWQKKIEKIYQDVKDVGDMIVRINAKRYSTSCYKLLPTEYDSVLESNFEYILTEDQQRVINEVLDDLSNSYPTNRLILADTGYGKTEVLIRAIGRAVYNGYNAILFVPTTILAYQHFMSMQKRLPNIKIALRTSISGSSNIEEANFVISTPFDVTKLDRDWAQRVALVVIDEEHLMGVVFKETLKEVFSKAHFLYSSATPIPRTYFMVKTGLIDISTINTPPPTHKKPKTLILTFTNYNQKLLILKKILEKSLNLGLKVMYVNNDIEELYEIWHELSQYAKTGIIHAKLSSKQIQKAFIDFIKGKLELILCTTIIQSGIDTPEFDVAIVDNPQKLGISQIYQIRGRVGRGSKDPYCYILMDHKYTNTNTFERISIFEKPDLSNVEIIQKDLDIRGPGGILSRKQSGHIQQVGLIQFLKMVNSYLNNEEDFPDIECDLPTYLPDSPIKNKLYRKLLTVKDIQEFNIIKSYIYDVYGKNLPKPAKNLLLLIEYKLKNKGRKGKIKVKIINDQVVEV
ncbi:MAG: DEAD/DEAH box helicase [bacterium]